MKVTLISYSKPVDNDKNSLLKKENKTLAPPLEKVDIQDLVSYCARVSNPSNQNNTSTNEKLIHYLMKNNHWSPFEMVSICLEIETTRDIARQILRHRSFSFQEFSQRYAIADLGFECKDARLQDFKNRQNSVDTDDVELQTNWILEQNKIVEASKQAYNWAIENGIAKEQARAVLPEGITVTKMYMNGTLRSWIHYIQLRSGNGTQKEHRDVAIACATAIEPIFPMICDFLSNVAFSHEVSAKQGK